MNGSSGTQVVFITITDIFKATVVYLIIALTTLLVSFFFALLCNSLRYFLRSRLAFVCRSHKNEDRFGVILKEDDVALQACSGLLVVFIAIAVFFGCLTRYEGITEVSHLMLATDACVLIAGAWLLLHVIPWTIARVAGEHILFFCWPLMQVLVKLCDPFLRLETYADTLVHRVAGQDPVPENLETFTDEIQSVVDEGEREGILESRAGKMIQRVMELRQEDVRAVMTPRTDIITIQVDQSLEQAREQLLTARHSRIPIVDGSTDNVVGILYARDLLEHMANPEEEKTLRDVVRKALYVPETTAINSMLERMKLERFHLAIVLDEYGGVTGLVTLEDILEEIVGNIEDEFDHEEGEQLTKVDPHTVWVDARMHIDELNDLLDLNFPEEGDFDTIAGLIFTELGRVPDVGEKVSFNGIQITVLEATERKISKLELFNPIRWPFEEQRASDSNGAMLTQPQND